MEEKIPLVSVIMPVYNTEAYIENTILSVLGQKYRNFEYIIINDGSTDGSSAICEKYEALDKRIVYVNSPNKGASSARNLGITYAKGEWIRFIDSDDQWNDLFLQKMIDRIDYNSQGSFFYCGYKEIDSANNTLRTSVSNNEGKFDSFIHKSGELRFPFNMDSFIVKSSILKEYDIKFDIGYKISEDIGFFLKILTITSAYALPEILTSYVRHSNSATTKEWKPEVWKSTILIFDNVDRYCKKFAPELYDRFLLIKSFRIYRYIVSLIKQGYIEEAILCIQEYGEELKWFSKNGSLFRDRLRAKAFLSKKKWVICMAC